MHRVHLRADIQRQDSICLVTLTAEQLYGEATIATQRPLDDPFWQEVEERLASQQTSDAFLKNAGSRLYELLFPQSHRITYEVNHQRAVGIGDEGVLEVQVRPLDDTLAVLPWECLYNPATKTWLAANSRTLLSRYVDARAAPGISVRPPIRLLAVTAEPPAAPQVGADMEVRALAQALAPTVRDGLLSVSTLHHATFASLREALRKAQPHLLHFAGHGWRAGAACGIVLESADEAGERLESERLGELVQQSRQLRLIVLNACDTFWSALALAKMGLATVGMRDKIRSEAAEPFCRSFYEAVAGGSPFDIAANRGRLGIRLACGGDRRDWCLPVAFAPAGRFDLIEVERKGRLIRVRSEPAGATVLVDDRPTGSVTPDTVLVKTGEEHDIRVTLEGYDASPKHRVAGGEGPPLEVDFQLSMSTGFLVVSCDRPGASVVACAHGGGAPVAVGVLGDPPLLGPARLAPGVWRVTASWPAQPGGRPVAVEQHVLIESGTVTQVILRRPAPAMRLWALVSAVGVVACAIILAGYALLRDTITEPSSAPAKAAPAAAGGAAAPPDLDMVALPAGHMRTGFPDVSILAAVLARHPDLSGSGVDALIAAGPRTVHVRPCFIDRQEVTNGRYRRFLETVAAQGDRQWRHAGQPADKTDHTPHGLTWNDPDFSRDDQPVVGIDWYDAYAFAAWNGKRLPSRDEWELAARGPAGSPYPWGAGYERLRCNDAAAPTNAPVAAGTFAGDVSPAGCSDMGGNVAEWTSSPAVEGAMVVKGGAWNRGPGDVFALVFMEMQAAPDVRSDSLGLRCAADAPPGGACPEGMVPIEGGTVVLGGEAGGLPALLRSVGGDLEVLRKGFLSESPRILPVRGFHICRGEITNAQYRRFLEVVRLEGDANYRHSEQPPRKDHTPAYWDSPAFNGHEQPVVGVDWYDAYAYAKWAGMRLPSAEEWEYAAHGSQQILYPWGDQFRPEASNAAEAPTQGPTPTCTFPLDRSPSGVMDLGGNVMEWTATDYSGSAVPAKLLKGGAWDKPGSVFAAVYLRACGAPLEYRGNDVGFRCVKDIEQ